MSVFNSFGHDFSSWFLKAGADGKRLTSPIAAASPAAPILPRPRKTERFLTKGASGQDGIARPQMRLDPVAALLCHAHRLDTFFQDQLVHRQIETLTGQPAAVRFGPWRLSWV